MADIVTATINNKRNVVAETAPASSMLMVLPLLPLLLSYEPDGHVGISVAVVDVAMGDVVVVCLGPSASSLLQIHFEHETAFVL